MGSKKHAAKKAAKRASVKRAAAKSKPKAKPKSASKSKPKAATKPTAATKPKAAAKPKAATKPKAKAKRATKIVLQFVPIAEAADILNVSAKSLQNAVRVGRIKSKRDDNRRYFQITVDPSTYVAGKNGRPSKGK